MGAGLIAVKVLAAPQPKRRQALRKIKLEPDATAHNPNHCG
jgi:hypothetical protein